VRKGSFSGATEDRVSRYMHSAVLLPSGKVLVVGGFGSSNETALYDPAAGTWSTGGNISYGRTHPTLAVLPDGSVAAVGGNDLTTVIERYVPASNGWSAADNLVGRRSTQVGRVARERRPARRGRERLHDRAQERRDLHLQRQQRHHPAGEWRHGERLDVTVQGWG
jgi:hypothetical protein